MHPLMFGTIASFAVMAIVGAIVGVAVGLLLLRAPLLRWQRVEVAVVVVLASVLGAKLGHVVFESAGHALPDGSEAQSMWQLLSHDPWHWARVTEQGYVQLTGVIAAVVVGVLYLRRQGLSEHIASVADAAAAGACAGIAIGRVGCFLGGCCYGASSSLPWAVRYPHDHVTNGAFVHPTPLYDSAAAIVALCVWTALRHAAPGVRAATVVVVLGVARVVTELMRGDADRGHIGPLSTSQLLALVLVAGAVVVLKRRRAHSRSVL